MRIISRPLTKATDLQKLRLSLLLGRLLEQDGLSIKGHPPPAIPVGKV